jgi:putative transposase
VAVALTQQDRGRGVPVRDGFDIHRCMGIDPVPRYKSQARDYMATFLDGLRQFFRDFRQFVVMASRKFRLNHTKWECKYHVVFIPKCRRKTLYVQLRQYLGEVFRKLAEQKESRIEEGHLMSDRVHMMISIPPKYAVSQVVGFIKRKSAIHLAPTYGEHRRNFVGQSFWARGYFVSSVGRDEEVIRNYIRNQEQEDQRLEQMNLWR